MPAPEKTAVLCADRMPERYRRLGHVDRPQILRTWTRGSLRPHLIRAWSQVVTPKGRSGASWPGVAAGVPRDTGAGS